MASGLQCPGCGHVHPVGLPEIARGDSTFRCYGCYRTLSVPEGWTGHPAPRPSAPVPGPTADAPPGAGTRDARSARLAGRRGFWPSGDPATGVDAATQMVPVATAGPATATDPNRPPADPNHPPADPNRPSADPNRPPVGPPGRPTGGADPGRSAGWPPSAARSAAPLGWVAPRRSDRPVPAALRAAVWAAAFTLGFVLTAVVLKKIGLLGVNTALDLYAGSGLHRFGVLLILLPLWAVLSATLAHFTLEALAARRRRRVAPAPDTPTSA